MSYRSRHKLKDTCDVCKSPVVQARHSTSGARIDLCVSCSEKLERGETLTDRWSFIWRIEDGTLYSRHPKQEEA